MGSWFIVTHTLDAQSARTERKGKSIWICSTEGFFSIVAHPTERDTLVVRARCVGDLLNFRRVAARTILARTLAEDLGVKALASAEIRRTPGRDYAFRLFANRVAVGIVLAEIVMANEATNFKTAIATSRTQADKLPAYARFHHDMEQWQRRLADGPRDWPVTPVFEPGSANMAGKKRKKPLATVRGSGNVASLAGGDARRNKTNT